MKEKIFEWEHKPGEELLFRFRPRRLSICSEASGKHLRAAQKEFLLALRSLLDDAVEYLDQKDKESPLKRTKIDVK